MQVIATQSRLLVHAHLKPLKRLQLQEAFLALYMAGACMRRGRC